MVPARPPPRRQPGAPRGGRGRSGAAAVRARPGAVGPGRAGPPRATSAPRCAPSTASSGSGGRGSAWSAATRYAGWCSPRRQVGAERVHVAADFGPYGRAPRPGRRGGARRRRHRAGPHRVAVRRRSRPGRRTAPATPTRSSRRSARRGRTTAGAARSTRPTGASWLELDEDTTDIPDPALARGLELPEAGEAAAGGAGRSSSTRVDAYDERPRQARRRRHLAHVRRTSSGARSTRARCSPTLARQRSAGAATYRKELAWREFYADVLFHQPRTARDYLRPEFARMAYDRAGRPARGVAGGAHRLPGRRRRACASCAPPAGCTTGSG